MAQRLSFMLLGLLLVMTIPSQTQQGVEATVREAVESQDTSYQLITTESFEGVIVPREKAADFVKALTGLEETEFWTPGKEDVVKLEGNLIAYLKKSGDKRSPELWKKTPGYKRQYAGIIKNGRKIIYANFFCTGFDSSNWKNVPVAVEDGGDCFFQIKYNVEANAFSELSINGEA